MRHPHVFKHSDNILAFIPPILDVKRDPDAGPEV